MTKRSTLGIEIVEKFSGIICLATHILLVQLSDMNMKKCLPSSEPFLGHTGKGPFLSSLDSLKFVPFSPKLVSTVTCLFEALMGDKSECQVSFDEEVCFSSYPVINKVIYFENPTEYFNIATNDKIAITNVQSINILTVPNVAILLCNLEYRYQASHDRHKLVPAQRNRNTVQL